MSRWGPGPRAVELLVRPIRESPAALLSHPAGYNTKRNPSREPQASGGDDGNAVHPF